MMSSCNYEIISPDQDDEDKMMPSSYSIKLALEEEESADHDEVTLSLLVDSQPSTPQVLAPALNDNLRFHVFFVYTNQDQDWAESVVEKLESPRLGFKCCCPHRDLGAAGLTQPQSILYGLKNSLKTVLVVTAEFLLSTWNSCDFLISEMDPESLKSDLVVVVLRDCETPSPLSELPAVRIEQHGWWTHLLARLSLPDDIPHSTDPSLSLSPSLVGLNPGLQSGSLLTSVKSRCLCCGKEVVDDPEVPDDLLTHGVQIPTDEYCAAVSQLMKGAKFHCHVWCYNMPLAIAIFSVLLALCLVFIPIVESHFLFEGQKTGLEFVHGGIVWLCILILYMIIAHLVRRKMKKTTYRQLSRVNTTFVKYNLLMGLENLGMADCNKYYLHFFYFEIGPCLAQTNTEWDVHLQAHLQELMVNLSDDCAVQCYSNAVSEVGSLQAAPAGDDEAASGLSDCITVLNNANITNAAVQGQAEDLLLSYSGEYINSLIGKRLSHPRRQRHVKGHQCLCQFVEHRVYKTGV